jgi:cytochrome b561-like protein
LTHTTNPALVIGIAVFIAGFSLVHLARTWRQLRSKVNLSEEVTYSTIQRNHALGDRVRLRRTLPHRTSRLSASILGQSARSDSHQLPLLGVSGIRLADTHIYLALLVIGVVLVHSAWDTYRMKAFLKIMNVSSGDLKGAWRRVRSFLGFSKQISFEPTPKYDLFQKAFHWTLIALGAFLLVSGLIEWEAVQIHGVPVFVLLDRVNNAFMDGFLRTGHLVAAMLFAGLVALHVYFAVLPQNRTLLRAITLGSSDSHQSSSVEPESTEGEPGR